LKTAYFLLFINFQIFELKNETRAILIRAALIPGVSLVAVNQILVPMGWGAGY